MGYEKKSSEANVNATTTKPTRDQVVAGLQALAEGNLQELEKLEQIIINQANAQMLLEDAATKADVQALQTSLHDEMDLLHQKIHELIYETSELHAAVVHTADLREVATKRISLYRRIKARLSVMKAALAAKREAKAEAKKAKAAERAAKKLAKQQQQAELEAATANA